MLRRKIKPRSGDGPSTKAAAEPSLHLPANDIRTPPTTAYSQNVSLPDASAANYIRVVSGIYRTAELLRLYELTSCSLIPHNPLKDYGSSPTQALTHAHRQPPIGGNIPKLYTNTKRRCATVRQKVLDTKREIPGNLGDDCF
ncbi:hypothetical protein J6590_005329 [Homalodisca vitripennis]|nr:hypothetical protein J6590_005329 [Homalodisca vitripennis]